MGIRLQFALWAGLMIAVVVGGLAFTVYRHETAVLQEGLEARGSSLTQMLARFLVDPVLKQDLAQIQEILVEGRDHGLYELAFVVEADGRILAHTNTRHMGKPLVEAGFLDGAADPGAEVQDLAARSRAIARYLEQVRKAARDGEVYRRTSRQGDRRWLEIATPIALDPGDDLGAYLHVGLETGPHIEAVVRETQVRLSRLFLPALLLGIVMSAFLAGYVARPIRLVVQNVRRIATGGWGERLDVAGPRELRILAEGVNQMSQEIREKIDQTRDVNERLDRKVYELSVLYEVSQKMNFRSYSPELLTYLLDTVLDALDAAWGSIMMVNEETDKLRTSIARGGSWDAQQSSEIPVGEGIAGYVFARGEPVISNLGYLDPRFAQISGQEKEYAKQIRQIICAPLLAEDKPIGVINVINKRDGSEFSENDLSLLVSLAAQAARSLENARLYGETIREKKTGLYVASYFEARVNDEVTHARRFGEEFSVLMADIDHFKRVNDNHGHLVGDDVLVKMARFIKETLRESIDVACRFGGEEFSILLPRTDREGAHAFAERLRKRTELESGETERNLPAITVSIGISTYPHDGLRYGELVEAADQRLYRSKQEGRNRVTS